MALYVKMGSYTGNGTSQSITGIGFQPIAVYAKCDTSAAESAVYKISSMGSGDCFAWADAGTAITTGITSIDSDGFSLGSGAVNTSSATGYYICIGGTSSNIVASTYTGNGTDNHDITGVGFQPDFVDVHANASANHYWRSSAHTGDDTSNWRAVINQNNLIQSFSTDGFQVGTRAGINGSGVTHYYLAIKTDSNVIKFGTYTGNATDDRNITGVGFDPVIVMTDGDTTSQAAFGTSDMGSDASTGLLGTDTITTNIIQSFITDGFQIGTSGLANTNLIVYYYIALKENAAAATDTTPETQVKVQPIPSVYGGYEIV